VIDTQAHSKPGESPEPRQRLSRRTTTALVATFLLIAIGALMSLVHLPYAVLKPGPITNILGNGTDGKALITIDGSSYPTKGALDFTTVAVLGGPNFPVNAWEVLAGLVDGSSQVLPEEQMFPRGTTGDQVEQENAAEMTGSQQEAIAIALRKVGKQVPEVVTISSVQPDAASGTTLKAGDVIRSVAGVPATSASAVRDAIQRTKAGASVTVVVSRAGTQRTLPVKTGSADGRTVLGVMLRTSFDFPVKVRINAGDVGGPSAGMMFSLAIYDKLTPGALTGGAEIAGTGTIDASGQVGPIGGIRQKLVGAREGGASYFLAPSDNCPEVVGHVPEGLQVVRVATFDQARAAVESIAAKKAASLPSCVTTAATR